MTRLRDERGQAMLMTVLFVTALIGATALTVDLGSWFREHRQAQATADAAALAGAQALPFTPAKAYDDAMAYANKNGAGVAAGDITFRTDFETNDTVAVAVARTAPGFFSRLFAIDSATVHARAAARAGIPIEARWAAPIVVNKLHDKLSGPGCPCFRSSTTLPLGKAANLGAPGAFGLVNLDRTTNGAVGSSTLGDWIANGFDEYMPKGKYYSDPGAKYNSSEVRDALAGRLNGELLFPVYDTLTGNGSNAQYNVVGWVGFHLSGYDMNGSTATLDGYFTRVIWDGVQSNKKSESGLDFGVRTIALVN